MENYVLVHKIRNFILENRYHGLWFLLEVLHLDINHMVIFLILLA